MSETEVTANTAIQKSSLAESSIGNLSDLQTEEKGSLVGAINEVFEQGGGDLEEIPYSSIEGVDNSGEFSSSAVKPIDYFLVLNKQIVTIRFRSYGIAFKIKNTGEFGKIPGNPLNLKTNSSIDFTVSLSTQSSGSYSPVRVELRFNGSDTILKCIEYSTSISNSYYFTQINTITLLIRPNVQEVAVLFNSIIDSNYVSELIEQNEQLANTIDDMGAKVMLLTQATNKLIEANKDSMSTQDYSALKLAAKTLETM